MRLATRKHDHDDILKFQNLTQIQQTNSKFHQSLEDDALFRQKFSLLLFSNIPSQPARSPSAAPSLSPGSGLSKCNPRLGRSVHYASRTKRRRRLTNQRGEGVLPFLEIVRLFCFSFFRNSYPLRFTLYSLARRG